MITILLAILAAGGSFSAAYFGADFGLGWSIFLGLAAFMVVQATLGIMLQKRLKRDMEGVQQILANGQKKLQLKTQSWQFRPPSSLAAAQKEIFEDTRTFVHAAIAEVDKLSRYRGWVPLIDRQLATAKVNLHWMIKEFDAVDKLMPRVMLIDPLMAAIKMARMYMKGESNEALEKVYRKGARRLRYNQNVLLAALWSWILVKRNDVDGAFKALTEALKSSDNEVLKANHERLMNNRPLQFTNSQLGDQWFALHLEEPKVHMQRQRSVYR